MAISSIQYNLNGLSGAYVQRLTEATKKKLIQLGIPFTDKTTESEAKALIVKAENSDKTNKDKQQSSLSNQNKAPHDELLERAKKLANRVGVKFDDNTTLKQLLPLIQNSLEEKINNNKDNIALLTELKVLNDELSMLQAQAEGASSLYGANQSLMNSLETLSQYNKQFLKNNQNR